MATTQVQDDQALDYRSNASAKMLAEGIYLALVTEQTDGQTKIDDEYICPSCMRGALGVIDVTRPDGTTVIALACNECRYVEEAI